jgi:predicted nuclease of predicted toxin-antitoxin system
MKFVVDAQLPPALAAWLRDKGHDAVAVREIGLREADDGDIWSYARAERAIVVTKDEDFGRLAAAAPDARVL